MTKHLVLKLAVAATVAAGTYGMAATLGVTGIGLGAGSVSLTPCDADGVSTSLAPVWDATDKRYEVSAVVVDGIAAACNGKDALLTVVDASGDSLLEATGTIVAGPGDTTHTLALGSALSVGVVDGLRLTIAG